MNKISDIIILCVGTNKLTGDCLGPLVGQKLNYLLKDKENIKIYGNMNENLHYKNARHIIDKISKNSKQSFVITVDSALGKKNMIEKIYFSTGEIQIGRALDKNISFFSNINIKGVVGQNNNSPNENLNTLNLVKIETIYKLANIIAYDVCRIVKNINYV